MKNSEILGFPDLFLLIWEKHPLRKSIPSHEEFNQCWWWGLLINIINSAWFQGKHVWLPGEVQYFMVSQNCSKVSLLPPRWASIAPGQVLATPDWASLSPGKASFFKDKKNGYHISLQECKVSFNGSRVSSQDLRMSLMAPRWASKVWFLGWAPHDATVKYCNSKDEPIVSRLGLFSSNAYDF